MINILVAEDDENLSNIYCSILKINKYHPVVAKNGVEALDILDKKHIDLIITDIMMPEMDGYELIDTLRHHGYGTPVMMITVKESFHDKERGFLAGVDDYMVKPINWNEMILRIGALLRRARISEERKIICGTTIIDHDSLTVIDETCIHTLPPKEFQLLYKLISYSGKIFTRQQLMDEIWGLDTVTDERTVDVHINHLRERFRHNHDFQIVTVRGLGYKAVRKE